MKSCKILHINDGNDTELQNGDWLYVATFPRTEEIIESYLHDGYELKQMIPDFTPAINEAGNYTFYKSGIIVYLEKEVESA